MTLFACLLVLAPQGAQSLDRLVSAEVGAASAPIAIADLSKQVGYPLEAMPSTQRDILVIKVDKVPLSDLLARIANVTGAKWESTSNGKRLVRDAETLRIEAEAEREMRERNLRSMVEKSRLQSIEEGALTDRAAKSAAIRLVDLHLQMAEKGFDGRLQDQIRAISDVAPINRLMRKVVSGIDPKFLSSFPANRNVVFSDKPNRMQRQLPSDLRAWVGIFRSEQATWTQALRNERQRRALGESEAMESDLDISEHEIAKVVLSVRRLRGHPDYWLNLYLIGTNGKFLGTASSGLDYSFEAIRTQREARATAGAAEEAIRLSGKSRLLVEGWRRFSDVATEPANSSASFLDPELKGILMWPERTEPLSLVYSNALFEVARILDVDIVAVPNDKWIFGAPEPFRSGDVKPSRFLKQLEAYSASVVKEGNWLTIRDVVPSDARAIRHDRRILGSFLRRADTEGRISIDNIADFAFRSGLTEDDFLAPVYVNVLGVVKSGEEYPGRWNAMRLYGSMTVQQRRSLTASNGIPFRLLSPTQIAILQDTVFHGPWSLIEAEVPPPSTAGDSEELPVQLQLAEVNEPTEVLPNGFTGNELLLFDDETKPKFFAYLKPDGGQLDYWGEQTLDVPGIAQILFRSERPDLFADYRSGGPPKGKLDKLRAGHERSLKITLRLTAKAKIEDTARESLKVGEPMEIGRLPADTQKGVQDELAKLRTRYRDKQPPNSKGGQVPPPLRRPANAETLRLNRN